MPAGTTRIDLGTEYLGGLRTPNAEQAGFTPRVDATGTNFEYVGAQLLSATGTWDASSETIHVSGSGARTITLPDPTNARAGRTVRIVDVAGSAGAGNITIDPSGSGTIASAGGSAASTLVLSSNFASALLEWVSAGVWVRVS